MWSQKFSQAKYKLNEEMETKERISESLESLQLRSCSSWSLKQTRQPENLTWTEPQLSFMTSKGLLGY